MTPITVERVIRLSLKTILEGQGELESRLEAVSRLLQRLPVVARSRIVGILKARLKRALRSKTATLRSAALPTDSLKETLKSQADRNGMLLFEEITDRTLLAGFSFQQGDDRLDCSLRNNIRKLYGNPNREIGTTTG